MPGFTHESDEIISRNPRRHRVDERMNIDPIMFHEPPVQNGADPPGFVIDHGKGRHRTGLHTQMLPQLIGGAETHPARPADHFMDRFEIDPRIFQRRNQKKIALFVLDEEIFDMSARNFTAQAFRLFNREHGRMGEGLGFDAHVIEKGKKIVGRGGHGRSFSKGITGSPLLEARRGPRQEANPL